ncbi:hypothetical protein BZA05DRAFT_10514 [Tricharina praecox]|uniref:uncharacterized protein n=1 Tax=Tricharina praecox TaxID=43433 RepID=UPI00221FD27F|nr:uncharacterized protein BZA05DRAFT_10514 [Tricharina praecox]KAI5858670.1 hypothetical protein BZA05DRAFT_10514 [Tricharina praecox]
MGIPGLFAELGPGERVSLAKYAADHHTRIGRRLRIAVDASIWSFQVQSGKGGSNPALRTVYYRILRLLSHNITPLFVFDGPHRPAFKRGQKTNTKLTPSLIRLSKKLLKLFGVPFHTAPGEAEAECALLNREGIVDAVLSEDVDTLMFGAKTILRKWSGEGKSTAATHVTVHHADAIEARSKLTREGLVLVALMRGGDYLPEGVPGCGIKTAVEAARAGFGKDLYEVRADDKGLKEWRERLQHEMASNESGWFKRRNGKANVPAGFPNKEILGWYAEPMVSDAETVERLREAIVWDEQVDVVALREYTRDTFEWRGPGGANKFVRTLAPVVLAQHVWDRNTEMCKLIEAMHGRRNHSSTDGLVEMRISYTPVAVIPINKELEEEDDQEERREQAGVLDDDDSALMNDGEGGKNWNPLVAERIWILESFLSRGMQDRLDEYNSTQASKPAPKAKKPPAINTTTATRTITTRVATKTPTTATAKDGLVQPPITRHLKQTKNSGNSSPTSKGPSRPVISTVTSRAGSRAAPPAVNKTSTSPIKKAPIPPSPTKKAPIPSSPVKKAPIPPSPTKKASAPPRTQTTQTKRSEPLRLTASPTKVPASRASSVASPTRAPRTTSAAGLSQSKAPVRPVRPKSMIASSQSKLSASTTSDPRKAVAIDTRRIGASTSKSARQTPTSPLTQEPQFAPLVAEEPAETFAAESPIVETSVVATKEPEVARDASPIRGRPVNRFPPQTPIERVIKAMEVIDLTSPSPIRPSTTSTHLPLEEIDQIPATEGLSKWMEGVRIATASLEPRPKTRTKTPPPKRRPSPGIGKVASGSVAALLRNFETIVISPSPGPCGSAPATPIKVTSKPYFVDTSANKATTKPVAAATPIRVVSDPLAPEVVQNSPHVVVRRRGSKKPPSREGGSDGSSEPVEESVSPSVIMAHAGNVVRQEPWAVKEGPETVRVVIKEWIEAGWEVAGESDKVTEGCTVLEAVPVVDLTCA